MSLLIDDMDRRILALLEKDGRTPAARIAEEVGLSRPSVAERIEKLERSGVLLGVAAVVNPAALGRRVTAFISVKLRNTLGVKGRRAFDKLIGRDEILEVHTVAGDDCYLFKVRTDTIESLSALVSEMTRDPLSFSTRTTIVMETHCEKTGGVVRKGATS